MSFLNDTEKTLASAKAALTASQALPATISGMILQLQRLHDLASGLTKQVEAQKASAVEAGAAVSSLKKAVVDLQSQLAARDSIIATMEGHPDVVATKIKTARQRAESMAKDAAAAQQEADHLATQV